MNKEHQEQITELKSDLRAEIGTVKNSLDRHLEIYAKNGKELEAVKVNQTWLMRLTWAFMTPTISGIVYLIIRG